MDRELVVKRCPCRLELIQPILRPAELEALKRMSFRGWSTKVLDATWPISEGGNGLHAALQRICDEATAAIEAGYEFIVLSDRNQGACLGQLSMLGFCLVIPGPFTHGCMQGPCDK